MGTLVTDHDYLPVAGHPDDDECTHRSDGTDATYCGEPEELHVSCSCPFELRPGPEVGMPGYIELTGLDPECPVHDADDPA
ncbi:Uncharacterised protein [Mycobacteroides abscessus subsp. abscessus]|nr:Uncharacterised protein [Mycobacteroides abscessus subsp. abscessus]